ncbi:hypothetical protein GCM10008956_15950 [Deinococcus arenae]|uniref:Tyr recombinase domain-containing protein n=1 Tax=Deinococcus arenae TaxID=1452751 RepID=A0A8H9GNV6_9DEIO|nr:hypothetical protein GCM10008956_15950 [Deinococcus arenae]
MAGHHADRHGRALCHCPLAQRVSHGWEPHRALRDPDRIHDLRHPRLTHLIEGGADPRTVAARAGHTDPSVTLRLYTHGRAEVRKAALMQAAVGLNHLIPDKPAGVEEG